MAARKLLSGVPASPGVAVGRARLLDAPDSEASPVAAALRETEIARAGHALEQAALQLESLGGALRAEGRAGEADIVETGVLMARDPALADGVRRLISEDGVPAPAALVAAASKLADVIAGLDDPLLAARADDVRSLGRRASRLALGGRGSGAVPAPAGEELVILAAELGPADVAELSSGVAAIALAAGGVTTHAAIVARSLGIPMVVELGDAALGLDVGSELIVDGSAGSVLTAPGDDALQAARASATARRVRQERHAAERDLPAETREGHRVKVLVNVSSSAEVSAGIAAGAEGIGLLRTELAFLDASDWPSEGEHDAALYPIFAALGNRLATVRVMDFGGDKLAPLVGSSRLRGTALLLANPSALEAQLRAILAAAADAELRILFPMIESLEELGAAKDAVSRVLPDARCPLVGAMIETVDGVAAAEQIATEVDFLSIGTNDLAHSALAEDPAGPRRATAHHPTVLRLIHRTARAARLAGVPVEVCGEAASDPLIAPLLIGLGVDELSVGAARVGDVRSWVRNLAFSHANDLARQALELTDARGVELLVAKLAGSLSVAEAGNDVAQRRNGGLGIVPVGPKF